MGDAPMSSPPPRVRGHREVTSNIPVRGAPIGERCRAAGRAAAVVEVRDATFGPAAPCPMPDRPLVPRPDAATDEDRLSLNVWTPATASARRAWSSWIHGGGQGYQRLAAVRAAARRGDRRGRRQINRRQLAGLVSHPALATCPGAGRQLGLAMAAALAVRQRGVRRRSAAVTVYGQPPGRAASCTF
jgi:para-nitrobenzyl esterase